VSEGRGTLLEVEGVERGEEREDLRTGRLGGGEVDIVGWVGRGVPEGIFERIEVKG